PAHFAWASADLTGEEVMTLGYLQETAGQAGLAAVRIAMEDIGWDPLGHRFVDLDERVIRSICKLYPWEWIVSEPFGPHAIAQQRPLISSEPLRRQLQSNKALLTSL